MFSKVRIRKGALDYFRKLARQSSPKEIQAYLIGNVLSVDRIEVTDFAYTKNYHTQTANEVCWYSEEYLKLKSKIEGKGLRIVGDIHSHPNYDAVMSKVDYEGAVTQGLAVCGIVSVNNNRTLVRFWTIASALPCKIEYV